MLRFSDAWRQTFLDELAACGEVQAAARAAGIVPKTAYNHKHRDKRFARQRDRALSRVFAQLRVRRSGEAD
jgi:hypothetical protein